MLGSFAPGDVRATSAGERLDRGAKTSVIRDAPMWREARCSALARRAEGWRCSAEENGDIGREQSVDTHSNEAADSLKGNRRTSVSTKDTSRGKKRKKTTNALLAPRARGSRERKVKQAIGRSVRGERARTWRLQRKTRANKRTAEENVKRVGPPLTRPTDGSVRFRVSFCACLGLRVSRAGCFGPS